MSQFKGYLSNSESKMLREAEMKNCAKGNLNSVSRGCPTDFTSRFNIKAYNTVRRSGCQSTEEDKNENEDSS
jgi:hypothetical protein